MAKLAGNTAAAGNILSIGGTIGGLVSGYYAAETEKYKLRSISANNNASLIILLYNLIIFCVGIQNISNTQFQIILLIINILIYCAIYFKLFAYKYKLKI